jgi:DNA-binding transcriptional LysR family regulator
MAMLDKLRCFTAVAEDLHFSRAADRLHLTQPALSSQIRSLEARLGLMLFDRTTRQVALTPAGAALLPAARRLVEDGQRLAVLAAELRGAPRRKLTLGAAFYTIDIPERVTLLESFFAEHPDVALDVSPAWQRELVVELQAGRLDLALLIGMPVPRAQLAHEIAAIATVEILYPDDLPRMVLRREQIGLLIPRESSLAALPEVPVSALAGMRVSMLGQNHGLAIVEPLRQWLAEAGAQPVVPPEPHGIGVERYGRQFRIPAVTLGWFGGGGPADDMVRRPLAGLALATELALLHAPGDAAGDAAIFWEHARRCFG